MKSQETLSAGLLYAEARGGALEAVQIGKDLIALYPHDMRRPQPYVILLDPASGIIKHLDLGPVQSCSPRSARRRIAIDKSAFGKPSRSFSNDR